MQSATATATATATAGACVLKRGRMRSSSSTNSDNSNNNSGGAGSFAVTSSTDWAAMVAAAAALFHQSQRCHTAGDTEVPSAGSSKTAKLAAAATSKGKGNYTGFTLKSSTSKAASVAPAGSKRKAGALLSSAEYGSSTETDDEQAAVRRNAMRLKVSPPEAPPFGLASDDVYNDDKYDPVIPSRASLRLAYQRNSPPLGNELPADIFPMLSITDAPFETAALEQHGSFDPSMFQPGMRVLSGLTDFGTILSGQSRYTTVLSTHPPPSSLVSLIRPATF